MSRSRAPLRGPREVVTRLSRPSSLGRRAGNLAGTSRQRAIWSNVGSSGTEAARSSSTLKRYASVSFITNNIAFRVYLPKRNAWTTAFPCDAHG